MPPPVIEAGPLTLRPFDEDDIGWVCQVSQDPAIQANLAEVFDPYRMEHAVYFVRHLARAAWDDGRRAEFLVAGTAPGTRLGRVGLDLRPYDPGAAEIGYWMDPRARGRGVATAAARAVCQWATDRPLLLLDIDGVLNPFAAAGCPDGYAEHVLFAGEEPVRVCAGHGAWLRELAAEFTLVWVTAWGEEANRRLAPLLDLPRLPVIPLPPVPFPPGAKLPAVTQSMPAASRWPGWTTS